MSTLPSSHAQQPSWKQEVNRRLAEHKNRKGISVVDENASDGGQGTANSRAAAAAARVAARYAKTPTYSEMQATEARAALRVTEAATCAALGEQAAAQAALHNLESSSEGEETGDRKHRSRGAQVEDVRQRTWEPPEDSGSDSQAFEIRWEPDMQVHTAMQGQYGSARANWQPSAEELSFTDDGQTITDVEAAQPIHANLIEFPRELVATRRMRPRLTETHAGATSEVYRQLSIFEVDPSTISTDPAVAHEVAEPPSWSGHVWSAIGLYEQPVEEPQYRYERAIAATALSQAPLRLRLMATIVDFALILGLVSGMTAFVASKLHGLPGVKVSEFAAVATVLLVGVLYEGLFLFYAKCTPGMRFAQLSLCTFDDEHPTREQMKTRLAAMLLSLLPMGLGMLWAMFDEDHMSWHDRHSKTYLRQS